jgi:hypothetical protein
MKTKTFPKISSKQLIPSSDVCLVLPSLLFGHICCFLLICFNHSPGLQSWGVLPIINGLATFWLLAKSQNQFLNWNE